MRDRPPAAACRAVVQVYDAASGPVHALKGLTLEIPAGSVTAVVGPSGAGKSTLLRLLACLEPPTVGEVLIGGVPTSPLGGRARRRLAAAQVGYVFQLPGDNLLDDLTVAQHLRLAADMRGRDDGGALLETLSLAELASARPADLVPGEQQRVAFAMAAAGSPALVVADEPTASLDPDGAAAVVGLVADLAAGGQTIVLSTHDPAVVAAADQVLVIRAGTLAMEARGGGERLAVLDDAGRLALPADAAALLASGRARVSVDGDRIVVDPA